MLLTLVRHGQSASNAGLTLELDSALTPLGQKQALATAQRLVKEGVTQDGKHSLFASPFRRTLQTLAPLCELTGLSGEAFHEVCEYFSVRNEGYKTFLGMSPDKIEAEFPFVRVGLTFPCEDQWWPRFQEDDQAIYDRAVRARKSLIDRFFGRDAHVVVFSHADTIGRLIEAFRHEPPNMQGPMWSDNCGVSRLLITAPDTPAEALFLNDTSHLAALG